MNEDLTSLYGNRLHRFWHLARLDLLPEDQRDIVWQELLDLSVFFLMEGARD